KVTIKDSKEQNMSNIREAFAGAYIRAEDIKTPMVLEVSHVHQEVIGDDDRHVLYFVDYEKSLPLNKTNALALADLISEETDDWKGHKIELYRDSVMYQGKRTAAVRVRLPRQPQPQASKAKNAKGTEPNF